MEVLKHSKKSKLQNKALGSRSCKMARQGSKIDELNKTAAEILKYANGLIIPGGEDIEACSYNGSTPERISYRSLIELALLAEANRLKVPTMGVCRGAQMINVFFGGTLKDAKKTGSLNTLQWNVLLHREQLQGVLPEQFRAVSSHHQAADQIGKGLHVILQRKEIPKLLISEDGNFIGSQVHPEAYIDTNTWFTKKKDFKGITVEEMKTINSSTIKEAAEKILGECLKLKNRIQRNF